jgi:hypothetical protein
VVAMMIRVYLLWVCQRSGGRHFLFRWRSLTTVENDISLFIGMNYEFSFVSVLVHSSFDPLDFRSSDLIWS